jgi:hypothetical protein
MCGSSRFVASSGSSPQDAPTTRPGGPAQVPFSGRPTRSAHLSTTQEVANALGGYCTVCQRWVWLTLRRVPDGYPAIPSRTSSNSNRSPAGARRRGRNQACARFRWWRHPVDHLTSRRRFMNWLAFVYVSVRARHTPGLSASPTSCAPADGYRQAGAFRAALPHPLRSRHIVGGARANVNHTTGDCFGDACRSLPSAPQPPVRGQPRRRCQEHRRRAAEACCCARQVGRDPAHGELYRQPAVRDRSSLCATADRSSSGVPAANRRARGSHLLPGHCAIIVGLREPRPARRSAPESTRRWRVRGLSGRSG